MVSVKPRAVGYTVGTVGGLKVFDVDLNSLRPISGQNAGHLTDGVKILIFSFIYVIYRKDIYNLVNLIYNI